MNPHEPTCTPLVMPLVIITQYLVSLQAPPGPPVPAPEAGPPLPSRPWHSQVRERGRGREGGGERERERERERGDHCFYSTGSSHTPGC